jgi:L-asparaginase
VKLVLTNSEGGPGIPLTAEALLRGDDLLDAIEAGIRRVEEDPSVRSVGYGGAPNLFGEMELDASVMRGDTLETGAVAALRGFLHPFTVARRVMERLPHVMLAGEGAARFARETGEETANLLSPEAEADYHRWRAEHVPQHLLKRWPDIDATEIAWPKTVPVGGTTVFIASNGAGRFAGGVSTSGWFYKYPGRLGDSPVIGAGLYVDDRYGGAACTQTGEMTIRAGSARAIVLYMKKGATVEEACREAAEDIKHLRGGYIGPVTLHAVHRDGDHCVLGVNLKKPSTYWYWDETMAAPERRPVIPAD